MDTAFRDQVVDMLEAGLSTADIAWQMRRPAAEISAIAATVVLPVAAAAPAAPPVGVPPSEWSEDEDAIVDEMRLRLLEAVEIRAVLRERGFVRPTRSVGLRMRRLADRAARDTARRFTS